MQTVVSCGLRRYQWRLKGKVRGKGARGRSAPRSGVGQHAAPRWPAGNHSYARTAPKSDEAAPSRSGWSRTSPISESVGQSRWAWALRAPSPHHDASPHPKHLPARLGLLQSRARRGTEWQLHEQVRDGAINTADANAARADSGRELTVRSVSEWVTSDKPPGLLAYRSLFMMWTSDLWVIWVGPSEGRLSDTMDCLPLDLSVAPARSGGSEGAASGRCTPPSPPPSLSPGCRDSFTDSEDSDGQPSAGRKSCKTAAYKKSLMQRYCESHAYSNPVPSVIQPEPLHTLPPGLKPRRSCFFLFL